MSDKLRAAAKAALDAMKLAQGNHGTIMLAYPAIESWLYHRVDQRLDDAIKEAEDALAEPEQEPELIGYEHHEYRPYGAPGEIRIHAVLKSQYLHPDGSIGGDFQYLIDSYKTEKTTIKLIPLYTAPPRKEWVGLTDEEIDEIGRAVIGFNSLSGWENEFGLTIETKLREKNGV